MCVCRSFKHVRVGTFVGSGYATYVLLYHFIRASFLFFFFFVWYHQVNRRNLLEDSFAQVSAMNTGELRRWLRVRAVSSVLSVQRLLEPGYRARNGGGA